MNEREHSGFRDLVSVIAVCGFILLAALTAFLWSGPAQNWFGSLKDWMRVAPSTEQGGKAPQGPTAMDRHGNQAASCSALRRWRL
jgi:hypothetical protein